MSALADLVAAVTKAIAAIDAAQEAAIHAAAGVAEAATILAAQTAGSAIADIPAMFEQARAEAEQQAGQISEIAEGLRAYLASLGRAQSPSNAQAAPQAQRTIARGRPGVHTTPAQAKPAPVSQARIDELRRALPRPVQPEERQKTHGQWVAGSGEGDVGHIVSGRDEMEAAAVQFFKDQGARRMPATVADVEVKLAVHMRNQGITNATVVVNNEVCIGPFGCDTLLPKILPQGSALTVYGTSPDGQATGTTYLGQGKKP
ncbi:DddA-like double-stranded DNA deaminase toxin [Amycolatopsis sp. NPDC059027]|uniref:DddA-like double-stranded DNA deaminase toxin n=1 Tax=unclassified Amycolatopsis TaxID=2618356 RepID=UPI003672F4E2